MRYRRFKIRDWAAKQYFWVYVYEDVKEMQKDAKEYSPDMTLWDQTLGVCHPYTRERVEKGKKPKLHDNIGIVRLAVKHCTGSIVAHETIHAAMWMYRLRFKRAASFGHECGDKEEEFAYIYGHLFRDMTQKLYKYGYWK